MKVREHNDMTVGIALNETDGKRSQNVLALVIRGSTIYVNGIMDSVDANAMRQKSMCVQSMAVARGGQRPRPA